MVYMYNSDIDNLLNIFTLFLLYNLSASFSTLQTSSTCNFQDFLGRIGQHSVLKITSKLQFLLKFCSSYNSPVSSMLACKLYLKKQVQRCFCMKPKPDPFSSRPLISDWHYLYLHIPNEASGAQPPFFTLSFELLLLSSLKTQPTSNVEIFRSRMTAH